jgi:hypothetical protein
MSALFYELGGGTSHDFFECGYVGRSIRKAGQDRELFDGITRHQAIQSTHNARPLTPLSKTAAHLSPEMPCEAAFAHANLGCNCHQRRVPLTVVHQPCSCLHEFGVARQREVAARLFTAGHQLVLKLAHQFLCCGKVLGVEQRQNQCARLEKFRADEA